MNSNQPPGIAIVPVVWYVVGGLAAVVAGGMALDAARLLGLFGMVGSLFGAGGSGEATALQLLGIVLIAVGIGLVAMAYGAWNGLPWARTWGIVALVTAGLIKVGAILYFWMKYALLSGEMVTTLIFGAIHLLVAALLLRSEVLLDWFGVGGGGGKRPDPTEQLRLLIEQQRLEIRRLEQKMAASGDARTAGDTVFEPAPLPQGYLINRAPGGERRPLPLGDRSKAGRNPGSEIALHHPSSGREHAIITLESGRYFINDMNSKAGTFVNDRRVSGKHQLFDGDLVRMGGDNFVFLQTPPAK